MFESLAKARYALSFARHPLLVPLAEDRKDSPAVLAMAKRIKLSDWFDPPSTTGLPARHSLSPIRLAPWDQATIKLSIAKFLDGAFPQLWLESGSVKVTIFGTCEPPRELADAYHNVLITGFEFRGRHFAFTPPLKFA